MARLSSTATGKTVRFTRVVERSGRPHAHTLWFAPEKDAALKRALAAERVMTIIPRGAPGTTDVGVVGFDPQDHRGAQLLIFPKSLKPFASAQIVGIKFDLVAQPKIIPATPDEHRVRPTARKAAATPKRVPREPDLAPETTKSGLAPHSRASDEDPLPTERVAKSRLDPAKPPRGRSRRSDHTTPAEARDTSSHDSALLREIRAAMKELQRGKAVAAYQRLERAVREAR